MARLILKLTAAQLDSIKRGRPHDAHLVLSDDAQALLSNLSVVRIELVSREAGCPAITS